MFSDAVCKHFCEHFVQGQEIKAVQLYSQDELIRLINRNEHLSRVVLDDCQLVQDIEARAETLKFRPTSSSGETCWHVSAVLSRTEFVYMEDAAMQGFAAMEQLNGYSFVWFKRH